MILHRLRIFFILKACPATYISKILAFNKVLDRTGRGWSWTAAAAGRTEVNIEILMQIYETPQTNFVILSYLVSLLIVLGIISISF